ncbi:hypothetical protein NDA11_002388 [Ustilago hordei]|uniref:rRNA adenine N(6)-methyltransferase n=1 Tax=Ustilago hordei TaxID=120017 RepID=I2FYQ1_USTHO|nr:uncharacterized protein UHO2_03878 [Ustilago hordei]KAJ1037446.1 hypothetical protein NDA10_001180 [Ustilago hordei]KAJ1580071.1 hypothetical protein NDA15_005762 [Ustilago hordei]KAJ1581755.1 hypothetical protein NDA12_001318 [Ustilago hordei]KAJ1582389.1 hypothetical protein NDA11_002388 [Ustilago hordei]KAJ1600202.1 hypothetical protein NDA14_003601 [Ustilago hordei]
MVSIARTTRASIVELASSFRSVVTVSSSARVAALAQLRAGPSPRTFRTSTTLDSASSITIDSTKAASQGSSETKPVKPKRKRRTTEEMEAIRLANQALGVPIRSRRRTRRAVGAAIDLDVTESSVQKPEKTGKPGRRKNSQLSEKGAARLAKKEALAAARAAAAAAAAANDRKVLTAEETEYLLSEMTYDHLPPRGQWKKAFPNSKAYETSYRYFISNRSTIKDIISKLGITSEERKGEKVTIIEGYPGPGTFADEMLKLPKVEKVIALESTPCYVSKLGLLKAQMEEKQPGSGERFDILESSAYMWTTYNKLVDSGRLAHLNNRVTTSDGSFVDFSTSDFISLPHSDASWQKLSPIIFFAQLPNTVYGEQLFAQIITAIANRIWLFRHGRIQLSFICGESLAKRCLAEAGDKASRGKLGTTVQCLADVQVGRYAHELQPHGHHFFPPTMAMGPRVTVSGTSLIPNSNPSTGLTRTGMVMMTVTPKQEPLVKASEIEAFEFVTRNLFILRTKPIGDALTHVAPGGQNVLKMTSPEQVQKGLIKKEEVILPDHVVGELTNVQWACLARMFEKWPFRPRNLFEEGRVKVEKKHRH